MPANLSWPHARERCINRYYDPATGQFISVDPDVQSTGMPFAFASDDPINMVDALGLCGKWYGNHYVQYFKGACTHAGYEAAIAADERESYDDLNPGVLGEIGSVIEALPTGALDLRKFNEKYFGTGGPSLNLRVIGGLRPGSSAAQARGELFKIKMKVPDDYYAKPADSGNGWIFRPPGSNKNDNAFKAMDSGQNPSYPDGYGQRFNANGAPENLDGSGAISRDSTHVPFQPDDEIPISGFDGDG